MKNFASLWLIAMTAMTSASCSSTPRIDGRSPAAFERSHATVVAALSPEDRMRLSLAELIVLSRQGCLTSKSPASPPLINEILGGQADLVSCRKELNGLSFKDIMTLAYPDGEPAGGDSEDAA
ncbi:hypothetical protein [Xanthomonas sacchari]|uniref:hypothetical protein n=1 Tax=Xanthomonas sacchari TaxID=56458 RepID=UPI003B20E507